MMLNVVFLADGLNHWFYFTEVVSWHARKNLQEHTSINIHFSLLFNKTYVVFNLIVQSTHKPVADRTKRHITTGNNLNFEELHGFSLLLANNRHTIMVEGEDKSKQVACGGLADEEEQDHAWNGIDPGNGHVGKDNPVQSKTDSFKQAKTSGLVDSAFVQHIQERLDSPRQTSKCEDKEEVTGLIRKHILSKESGDSAGFALEGTIVIGRGVFVPEQDGCGVDIGIVPVDVCASMMRVVFVLPPR